jgi:hypothetical protein
VQRSFNAKIMFEIGRMTEEIEWAIRCCCICQLLENSPVGSGIEAGTMMNVLCHGLWFHLVSSQFKNLLID